MIPIHTIPSHAVTTDARQDSAVPLQLHHYRGDRGGGAVEACDWEVRREVEEAETARPQEQDGFAFIATMESNRW